MTVSPEKIAGLGFDDDAKRDLIAKTMRSCEHKAEGHDRLVAEQAAKHLLFHVNEALRSQLDALIAEPADFMTLAAHLSKVNAGRPVIERESDGAVFVHRDVAVEAMQALGARALAAEAQLARQGEALNAEVGDSKLTFDLERSFDHPRGAHAKAERSLYNVIDWTGGHRGQIALTPDEHYAISVIRPSRARSALGDQNG